MTGNLVFATPGTDGKVAVYNASGSTNVTVDVLAWFPDSSLKGFHAVTPSRLVDTASGVGAPKAKLIAAQTVSVPVVGAGGVPAEGVGAVVLQVVAARPSASTSLTVWATGTDRPTVASAPGPASVARLSTVIVKPGTARNTESGDFA